MSMSESDTTPPIEEEAQVKKVAADTVPRISTESTESTTTNSLDNIARLSLSSEGTDTHVNGSITESNETDLQSRIAALEHSNATLLAEKQKSDSAYNSLLQRVNEIRRSLTARFQQNEEQLTSNAETIERLENENQALTETVSALQAEITSLSADNSTLSSQVSALRREAYAFENRETEWDRERSKLEKLKRQLETEVDNLRLALNNWERTAEEEHNQAESSRNRILLLEEEIASYRDHQDAARSETERYREQVDQLRHALRDGQEEHKRELREAVEGMEEQIERLNGQVKHAEKRATEAEKLVEENQRELDRLKPFEAEVKEKSVLLGKTRHEAVILNEHLTKALRLLKRASPSSTVDKQVMTNFLLQFLSLPREDTKRFEILNLISSILEWNDEQRQKAGLARTSNVRRTNSNPMLSDYPLSPGKESMSELWINFLQREAAARESTGEGLVSPLGGRSEPGTPTPMGRK